MIIEIASLIDPPAYGLVFPLSERFRLPHQSFFHFKSCFPTFPSPVFPSEHELSLWKPNAALTVLDFAVRHGAVDADYEHYIEICHLLRGAFIDKKMAEPSRESKGGFYFGTEDAG